MTDNSNRHKILKQLSNTQGEKALGALNNEMARTANLLASETEYSRVRELLRELEIYAFRVPQESFKAMRLLLKRSQSDHFTFDATQIWFRDDFHPGNELAKNALEIIADIRYFDIEASVETFFEFAEHPDVTLKEKAQEGLRLCSEYNINVYYAGKNHDGLGPEPQLTVIDFLEKKYNKEQLQYGPIVKQLIDELLSPEMEGTSSDYQTITLSRAAIPATTEIAEIRQRALLLISNLFSTDLPIDKKQELISHLLSGTRQPIHECDEQLRNLLEKNTIFVFNQLKSIIPNLSFQLKQSVEHDVYWCFQHSISQKTRDAALEIRDQIYNDSEFLIYRNLIGFDSIFHDWENDAEDDSYEIEKALRKKAAASYIESISDNNWAEWRKRILLFSETESEDLATFPIFHDFLNMLSRTHPQYAFELIDCYSTEMTRFSIPMYRGLWNGPLHDQLRDLLITNAKEGKNLAGIIKLFWRSQNIDNDILLTALKTSILQSNTSALLEFLNLTCEESSSNKDFIINNLILPAMAALNEKEKFNWINYLWFNPQSRALISDLTPKDLQHILIACESVTEITSTSERTLAMIAKKHPELVLTVFENRFKNEVNHSSFKAMPFSFYDLPKALKDHADLVVAAVRKWNVEETYKFRYRGGRFIANLFPKFGSELEAALSPLAKSDDKNAATFVVGVLLNYDGQQFINGICRELIMTWPDDQDIRENVQNVMFQTGVVSGDYGFAEAYAQKAAAIHSWLSDESPSIQSFASDFISVLKRNEIRERNEAKEQIELRKHKYGVFSED